MKDVILVSENFVRSNTNVSKNLQDKFIQSAVREATDVDFEELVGTNLLNKLKELIEKQEVNAPENRIYKKLLDIAKYYLAYCAVARLVVISSVKIDNIGANVTSDDNVSALDFDDVFRLEKYYQNKADVYKKKVQIFLQKNVNEIPELYQDDCRDIHANVYSAASSGLWLGGARGKGTYKETRLRDKYHNKTLY